MGEGMNKSGHCSNWGLNSDGQMRSPNERVRRTQMGDIKPHRRFEVLVDVIVEPLGIHRVAKTLTTGDAQPRDGSRVDADVGTSASSTELVDRSEAKGTDEEDDDRDEDFYNVLTGRDQEQLDRKNSFMQMDRTSILGDTIEYMKELLEKINSLQLEIDQGSSNITGIFKILVKPNEVLVRNSPKSECGNSTRCLGSDVDWGNVDTMIEICCAGKPGLLLSSVNTLEVLGLRFNNVSLVVSMTLQCKLPAQRHQI
ncbi:uncharacterized protein LOC118349634 [Juglans regia]|uniref:Uncharacterized protein LOC118349634 n=1 Tax=Juglans regia TaxID=51240 RepID=A0A6P9F8S7_JUGRE|nr:uncharacterized protein LOC118349634 [Juglans regia]